MLIPAGRRARPVELPLVDAAGVVGYVLWSAWLVIFAVVLVVRQRRGAGLGRWPDDCPSTGAGGVSALSGLVLLRTFPVHADVADRR